MSRILVVEDEPAIAELISINLRHAGFEVTIAGDAEQAQVAVDGILPSLVVLDWMLPGQSGHALARAWRAQPRTRELPIIMLTARAEEADKVAGLDAGADDYLTKPFSYAVLIARLRALVRRGAAERPCLLQTGALRLDPAARKAWLDETELVLTARELSLLEFLVRRSGQVVSKRTILEHVWDDAFDGDPNIVEVYIRRLRTKLGEQFITTLRGAGYRLAEP